MKKRIIRGSVLAAVFVLALVVSSLVVNKNYSGKTAEMDGATLPMLAFEVEGQEVNWTEGHRKEMDLVSMRDTITPLDSRGGLKMHLYTMGASVQEVSYEVFSLDGGSSLQQGTCETEDVIAISLGNVLEEAEEAVLRVKLQLQGGSSLYYYTRICDGKDLEIRACLDYVNRLQENMLAKSQSDLLKRSLESNEEGNNTNLQHVTIHSDLEHASWGELRPEVQGQVRCQIQEAKAAYTAVTLRYQVQCAGDNNAEEIYDVKEFFRVRHTDGKDYLLTYDREIEERFDGNNVVLVRKGIILGLADQALPYQSNMAGTIVTFVQDRELWNYNQEENAFTQIFSFREPGKYDVRNENHKHSIQILSMEENGNVTFVVYGYMNRGMHEGESGAAIYYYKASGNIIEEKAFIPSVQNHLVMEEELGEIAYYNAEKNVLYMLADQTLYKLDYETQVKSVLLENLSEQQYVSSNDGHLLAYQKSETEVEVLDFKNDTKRSVQSPTGEGILPLGFLSSDFIYGLTRVEDQGVDAAGETIQAMYCLEIRDEQNEVVKNYQVRGLFVKGVEIDKNLITIHQIQKKNGIYVDVAEDYITNNEENAHTIVLQSYWTDLKETQYRLAFEAGIDQTKARVMTPVHVLNETDTKLAFQESQIRPLYLVYGLGELKGAYAQPGEAVNHARACDGVVVSPLQNYIWESGNRVAWYRNFEVPAFSAKSGESTLAASVRAVLAYEGTDVDAKAELNTKTVLELLQEYSGGEGIRLQGCAVQELCYLIDKGVPVIAQTGKDSAIVLVGYDAKTITYVDPASGSIRSKSMNEIDKMVRESGATFYAYTR